MMVAFLIKEKIWIVRVKCGRDDVLDSTSILKIGGFNHLFPWYHEIEYVRTATIELIDAVLFVLT